MNTIDKTLAVEAAAKAVYGPALWDEADLLTQYYVKESVLPAVEAVLALLEAPAPHWIMKA